VLGNPCGRGFEGQTICGLAFSAQCAPQMATRCAEGKRRFWGVPGLFSCERGGCGLGDARGLTRAPGLPLESSVVSKNSRPRHMGCDAYLEVGVGPRVDALVSPQSPARSPRRVPAPSGRSRLRMRPFVGRAACCRVAAASGFARCGRKPWPRERNAAKSSWLGSPCS
jgi:hypothetical protein